MNYCYYDQRTSVRPSSDFSVICLVKFLPVDRLTKCVDLLSPFFVAPSVSPDFLSQVL